MKGMEKERRLGDPELSRPALALAKRFVQRWDIYARQLDDGRYICVHEPLTVDQLFAHLRGEITLGAYLLDQKSQARFVVFDADEPQGFERLARLNSLLSVEGIPSYLESSRRGGHLWFFLAKPTSGYAVRSFARGVLSAHEVDGIEVFPKQDRLSNGPGSMIRMPFGIHRVSGLRYGFYQPDGSPLAPTLREQINTLSTPQTVPEVVFESYTSYVSPEPPITLVDRFDKPTDVLSERIKSSVTVLEFVSQYVDLKPAGSGVIGRCPFHDDQHPSFGVNDRENYWHCFAGCGGGSIIDFWMKRQGYDFTRAVRELADMLLES